MSNYPQRAADNILPLSIAGTLPEAFDEWFFTEKTYDHEAPIETCKLCDQEDVRYHFEIANKHTGKTLWVGSRCILRFDVSVYENGRRLTVAEAQTKLAKLADKMRLDSCISALRKLAAAENSDLLHNALKYYEQKKKLSPKFAAVVFWRLNENHIDHCPSFFNVSLKRKKHINDLRDMETWRVHYFWKALSPAQRQKAIELGHTPPPSA